jgi:hypothetical protein
MAVTFRYFTFIWEESNKKLYIAQMNTTQQKMENLISFNASGMYPRSITGGK